LSVQRQFLAGSPLAPFRFGGVVRAPELAPAAVAALDHCATALASHFGLRGINGLDGLWDGNQLWVLEINPRPTASLALLDPRLQAAALRAHLQTAPGAAGSRPDWPAALPRLTDALNPGMAVVYASAQLSIPADFRFPPGCHDLPVLPRVFAAGDPVCSVQVRTGGIEELRALIRTLRECLFALAGADLLSSL
jgi:predicted ATP-grasp superfamily ATP-dependent carboligase